MVRLQSSLSLCVMMVVAAPIGSAQTVVPIRELAPIEAKSTGYFGTILNVRALADGKVLLNDGGNRQLIVLDALLASRTVLIGAGTDGGQSYGPRAAPLIPYVADSSLFLDRASSSLVVISPAGKVDHTIAPPTRDVTFALSLSASGTDRDGNLVYRGMIEANEAMGGAGKPTVLTVPDSAVILRANFTTRSVDTVARVKLSNGSRTETLRDKFDTIRTTRYVNPLSENDEWTVLSGGSIAIIRGHDYHVDFIRPDGTRVPGVKLPFDAKRLTDGDKQAIVDSARAAEEKRAQARAAAAAPARPPAEGSLERRLGTALPEVVKFVPLSEMADYQPAIRPGAVKADLDDNMWILPATSAQSKNSELVYDVVNSAGKLTHRVRIPPNRSIAGFGHSGIVYLMMKEPDGWVLERTRVLK